ncbi:MAG: exo-beta-N-acetylmuramidase NamZ domain-containing protein, partial [Flavisolibacter sp.]
MNRIILSSLLLGFICCQSVKTKDSNNTVATTPPAIKTGAEQTDKYLNLLKGKRVAILGNQTSVIGNTHLVDSLQQLGVQIMKVFGPEHGFRGQASAGVEVQDETDKRTGIPVISLYGPKRKP